MPAGYLELVRKHRLVGVFHPDGDRSENNDAVGAMTVDMITGTPMEQEYRCAGVTSTATSSGSPSQLTVFPGTSHFFDLARTALVLDVC